MHLRALRSLARLHAPCRACHLKCTAVVFARKYSGSPVRALATLSVVFCSARRAVPEFVPGLTPRKPIKLNAHLSLRHGLQSITYLHPAIIRSDDAITPHRLRLLRRHLLLRSKGKS
jgi:hypothetical protein